jgi:hypothetical protein
MTDIDWEDIPMGQLGAAVDIVRALAAKDAPMWENPYGTDDQCLFCTGTDVAADAHDLKCPWRMAVEWIAAQQRDEECPVCHDTYIDLESHQRDQHNPLTWEGRYLALREAYDKNRAALADAEQRGYEAGHTAATRFALPLIRQPDGEQTDVDRSKP